MTETHDWKERATPETLRARGLSAALTADDLEASLAWYCDVVGFTLSERYEEDGELRAAAVRAGDVEIVISQDDGALGTGRAKGQGIRLYFDTAQDVDRIAADIRARGGTLASEPTDMPWGARAFSLEDPSGFRLTISAGG